MSRTIIDQILNDGYVGIKTVDVLGVRVLKKLFPGKVLTIFLTVDKDLLKTRLENAGEAEIEKRLSNYEERHQYINESDFIVENNGTLDEAVQKVHSIITQHI